MAGRLVKLPAAATAQISDTGNINAAEQDCCNSASDCLLLVGKALDFFCLHFRQPLPLAELAWGLGVSERRLLFCFDRARGMTPSQALLEFRLNRLFLTIRDYPDQSLRRSIRECGLGHTGHIIELFETSFGIAMTLFLLTCRRAQEDRSFRRQHPLRHQLVLPCR